MIGRAVLGALAATLLWAVPMSAGAVSITVSPATVVLDAQPGSTTTFTLRVANQEEAPVELFAYTWDYWHGKEGRFYAPPGTTPRSAAGWIEIVPRTQVVGGTELLEFLATVSVPPDAEGGYYATLFIQTGADPSTSGATAAAAGRIGARVFLEVEGTTSTHIEVVQGGLIPPSETKSVRIAVHVRNDGNTHSAVQFKGVLRTPGGEVLQSVTSGKPIWVLPGETLPIEVPYSGVLEPGAYELAGAVLYGDTGAVPVVLPLVVGASPAPR